MSPPEKSINFTLNGRQLKLTKSQVELAVQKVSPEPIRSHAVVIGAQRFPVKQAFSEATGLDRLDFTSEVARRHLDHLGFKLEREQN